MSEQVAIRYQIEGATEGADGVARLKGSVDQLDQSLQQSAREIETWESAAQGAGSAASDVAGSLEGFGGQARQVASHVQGLTGLVANLAGQFGGQGGAVGTGAHLASALAGVASQALAFGSIIGPGGAMFGAAIGLVPVLAELMGANDDVAHATDAMTAAQRDFTLQAGNSLEAIDQLIQAQHRLAAETQRRERIEQGLGGVDEQFAAAELAGQRLGRLRAEDIELRREAERLDHTDWENAERLHEIETRRAELHTQIRDTQAESHRLGALALQAQEEERQIATDILEIDQEDAHAAAERARHAQGAASARRAEAAAAREQREFERLLTSAGGQGTRESIGRLARGLTADEDRQREEARVHAVQSLHELQERRRHEAEQRSERARQQLEQQRERRQDEFHRARLRQEAEYTGALEHTGQIFGSVFGNAFEKAITGQQDFGKALQDGARQALIQTGTQMMVEGAGALLTAVGLSILNPPAAGTKAVEGAGKLALGASLGGIGAAIPSTSAAGGSSKAPSPQSSTSSASEGSKAPAPVNVYMNAPSVIGGTIDAWGRDAARSILRGQRRFGRTR